MFLDLFSNYYKRGVAFTCQKNSCSLWVYVWMLICCCFLTIPFSTGFRRSTLNNGAYVPFLLLWSLVLTCERNHSRVKENRDFSRILKADVRFNFTCLLVNSGSISAVVTIERHFLQLLRNLLMGCKIKWVSFALKKTTSVRYF